MKSYTAVLLVNLGTPDSPVPVDVRKYLREFLSDRRVMDIGTVSRFLLVNLIIAPFRAPRSAKMYQQVWTERGSPLLVYGQEVCQMLQEELGNQYVVRLAMRYQNPSIESQLEQLRRQHIRKMIVLPLFPQYASATTGSVHEEVMRCLSKWEQIPQITFIDTYANNQKMISVYAELGRKYLQEHQFDHVIFSYHGLPERQLRKADPYQRCIIDKHCCDTYYEVNRLCYRAQCFHTSRLLAQALDLTPDQYTTSFQSRLGTDPWIRPYTDETIKKLVAEGKKRVLAFSPSFVADCLETTVEIGKEYKKLFEEAGGEHWQMVESLNNHPRWVETLKDIVLANS
ncbi:MAG: ferrochelatase [Cytophagales bacterium]|nr:ferrochelatase [Bernardetiaceae bacterium]MDW8210483.1 ferrochelatase [Cytophagales bacterium]